MSTVEKWMTRNPVTIEEDASIIEAIHLMKEREVRRLPVMKKGRFVGLVTDRMIKEYTPSKATSLDTWEIHYLLSKTPVKEAMNPKPCTVTPQTSLCEAAQMILDRKLYGLCVIDEAGNLAGILTTTNIIEALITSCKAQQNSEQQ